MILRRLGNKTKLAHKIQCFFPKHTMYIEPFFGAGGMFFNKPKAQYNILNDSDSEVFNLFQCLKQDKNRLYDEVKHMPISEELFKWWEVNEETEPYLKALRFLMLSNFGLYGKLGSMRLNNSNSKDILLAGIHKTFEFIHDCDFANRDFRDFFKQIPSGKSDYFVYADPPYLDTSDNYQSSFKPNDSIDLFNCLTDSGFNWAMSEFGHEFIINQAKERRLYVTIIGERRSIKNTNTEILITNYKPIIQHSIF